MTHSPRWPLAAGLAAMLALATACGGDDGADPGDAAADGADGADVADATALEGRSLYTFTLTLEDGTVIVLDRELTGREAQHYAFGSTHIAPAVSLAVGDNVTVPRTIQLELNFGVVVPSNEHPIATDGPGEYAFSATPPELSVNVSGLPYRSRVEGASGAITVDAWSSAPGGVVSGSLSGRLIQDTPAEIKRHLDVEGTFYLTLPERQGGQPR